MDTDAKIAALKEATREANEVLGDIKRTLREAREFADKEVPALVRKAYEPVVKEGLDDWATELKAHTEKATQQVFTRFDAIADMLLGEDRKSKKLGLPTVGEMVEKKVTPPKQDEGSMPF